MPCPTGMLKLFNLPPKSSLRSSSTSDLSLVARILGVSPILDVYLCPLCHRIWGRSLGGAQTNL
nr:CBM_HP1_G0008220.mRNA.1.CDS.1 [Saccharomyces cerevisiae]